MKNFDYSNLNFDYNFEAELAFTKQYKNSSTEDISIREARCLSTIIPYMALPMEKDDWFVGRRRYRLTAISPCFGANNLDHLGYCADTTTMKKLLTATSLKGKAYREVEEMINFWSTEDCIPKIRSRFSKQMKKELIYDDWENNSAAIFPLYRLAGAHLDFDKLIRLGFKGLIEEIEHSKQMSNRSKKQINLLNAMQDLLLTMINLLKLYEKEVDAQICIGNNEETARLKQVKKTLINLQINKPSSYHEALQIVWIYTAFSGTLDFNRCDEYFGDLYVHDIDNGIITYEEALEYTLSFYRLAKEVIGRDTRIILGGRGRRNPKNADRFALLAMEACAIHHQAQPQLSLRMYDGMSQKVRKAAMDLLATKITYPLLYNDEANINAIKKMMNVSLAEAEQYGFFGCGEYVINHKSMGTPNAIINLLKVLEITLHNGYDTVGKRNTGLKTGEFNDFENFEELLSAYKKQAEYYTKIAAEVQKLIYEVTNESASMLFMSILSDDCILRAKSVLDGGIRYLAGTYETYGNVSTADSLNAIKKTVYEKNIISPKKMLEMLDNNFVGYEKERNLLLDIPKYGNEDESADEMVCIVNNHICKFTAAQAERVGLASYLVVIINNSANTVLGKNTGASADGRKAYTYMSNGNCPTAGMDRSGITSMLNSISKPDVSLTAGSAQNIKLNEELFTRHRDKLNALIDSVFSLGLLSLSISVVNSKDMEMAILHPDQFQNLFVRVGGFSARFIDLSAEVQRDMINRTLY